MCATRAAQAEFSDLGTSDFNLYRQNTYRGKMFQDTVIAGHTCWTFCTGFFFSILPNNYLLDRILYFVCVVTAVLIIKSVLKINFPMKINQE